MEGIWIIPAAPLCKSVKSSLVCFYNCGSSVTLRLGFLTESRSEGSKIATGSSAAHICGRGGIGRLDGFRFRYLSGVRVRVPPPAPNQYNPNQIFLIGDGFGLFVFFEKFEDTHFRNGVVKRPESKPRGPRKPKLAKDKEDNYENHQKL